MSSERNNDTEPMNENDKKIEAVTPEKPVNPDSQAEPKSPANGVQPKGWFEALWIEILAPLPPVWRKTIVVVIALGVVLLAVVKLLPAGCGGPAPRPGPFVIQEREHRIQAGTNTLDADAAGVAYLGVSQLVIESNAVIRFGPGVAKAVIVAKKAEILGPFWVEGKGDPGSKGTNGPDGTQPDYGLKGLPGGKGGPGSNGTAGVRVELWLGGRDLSDLRLIRADLSGGPGGGGGKGGKGGLGGGDKSGFRVINGGEGGNGGAGGDGGNGGNGGSIFVGYWGGGWAQKGGTSSNSIPGASLACAGGSPGAAGSGGERGDGHPGRSGRPNDSRGGGPGAPGATGSPGVSGNPGTVTVTPVRTPNFVVRK